ncbi:hypothetical protein B0T24DRAFT_612292 [Lasiosphaeria ovina]|uniref:Uncharacterized protein n=1 Tax=Lasiosphaeria ovina TaxID=92902 RepID=A0AAE0TS50_9PEZI|nr:hypothetical protein B0T24DRAFT_612292 [Lasiosphaeria ovina]
MSPPGPDPLKGRMSRVRLSPSMGRYKRHASSEDQNWVIARSLKAQYLRDMRRYRFQCFLGKLSPFPAPSPAPAPPTKPVCPSTRPFKWLISSHHVPQEYHGWKRLRDQAPWYLQLRFLFVDMPKQLRSEGGIYLWRDNMVEHLSGSVIEKSQRSSRRHLKFAKRLVFSVQANDQHHSLAGRWLVVCYLWGQSREWIQNVNIRSLVSFGSAFCVRGYKLETRKAKPIHEWNLFYEYQRGVATYRQSTRLFYGSFLWGYNPPEVLPGMALPATHLQLADLMQTQARALICASHERPAEFQKEDFSAYPPLVIMPPSR